MKIAVTAAGPDLESRVDPRFGRARYILIVDTETGELLEALDNETNRNAPGGAGVQAVQAVADQGVSWVITGNVGPKAFQALQAAGIQAAVGASGTAAQAVEAFKAGELPRAAEAGAEGRPPERGES